MRHRHITADKALVEIIRDEENDRGSYKKTGWDGVSKWYPYESREKGSDTIGYGHKMNVIPKGSTAEEIRKLETVMIKGVPVNLRTEGLTEAQARWLLNADLLDHEKTAKTEYNSLKHNDTRLWGELSNAERNTYTEIVFNIGTLQERAGGKTIRGKWGWPTLTDNMIAWNANKTKANLKKVIDQISRTDDKGRRLGRVAPIGKHHTTMYDAIANPTPSTNPSTQTPVEKLMALPGFDRLNDHMRANLLRAIVEEDVRLEQDRADAQLEYDHQQMMIEENNDRETEGRLRAREAQQKQQAADKAIEEEEALLLKDEAPVDETSKVITEKLADV
ncbi:MAG: hypothetical protein DRI24_15830, partial [Deltaproteobacteria bacterium]